MAAPRPLLAPVTMNTFEAMSAETGGVIECSSLVIMRKKKEMVFGRLFFLAKEG